uniref:thymidine kinase n=1 Tax=viral metagenome TaxID=1070528 RepID=A0A6C0ITX8_9ZZZZ
MNNSAKLDIILGPMFSGKTTKLLDIMDAFDKKDVKYIAIKPEIDNRYTDTDNNYIISHNLKKKQCNITSNLKDIFEEIKVKQESDSIQYILIDEGQFFNNLYNFCILCLEKLNINVIVTGLDGDYKRKPMGEILDLLPIANTITKLSSKCNVCQEDAIFTHRTVANTDQVLIGGSDEYIPLCRKHYVEKNTMTETTFDS